MTDPIHAAYGIPPEGLVDVGEGAVQCSPRVPGSTALECIQPGSLASIVVLAPQNVVERRRVLALALRALRPGAPMTALALNNRGGARLVDELRGFACTASSRPKQHHQIVATTRPERFSDLDTAALDEAVAAGAPRLLQGLAPSSGGLWTQPGLFSWDRVDPGSALLAAHLPRLDGAGCDLGCGIGLLARAVREAGAAGPLVLLDNDSRALDCARRNVPGDKVTTLWIDARTPRGLPTGLDFVVCNPPFHDGGAEDRALGQAFIRAAGVMLRPGGTLWLVANRHLPYEATLQQVFDGVESIAQHGGYKVMAARSALKGARGAPTAKTRRRSA